MPMKNPPYPGRHVLKDYLEPLGLSITKAAEILGVQRLTLSNLINGKNGVSPEMAIRISKAFGGRSGNLAAAADAVRTRRRGSTKPSSR
jgi:antitoxin HigA-1